MNHYFLLISTYYIKYEKKKLKYYRVYIVYLGEKRRKTLNMIVLDFDVCVDFPLRSQIVEKT